MKEKTDRTSTLFKLKLFGNDKAQLLSLITEWLKSDEKLHLVMTPNPEQIIQSRENKLFLQTLQSADLLLPDGVGLVIASRILGQPIKEKISGVWLVEKLLNHAAQKDLKILLIGGRNYAQDDFFHYQQTKIHWTTGFDDVSQPTKEEQEQLKVLIGRLKPDLVFVAFGAPHQEFWLAQNRDLLEENGVKIGMVVGGSFDFFLNKVRRAPKIIRKLGLEWLFRLVIQPWRWRRQLRLIKFSSLVLKKACCQ